MNLIQCSSFIDTRAPIAQVAVEMGIEIEIEIMIMNPDQEAADQ